MYGTNICDHDRLPSGQIDTNVIHTMHISIELSSNDHMICGTSINHPLSGRNYGFDSKFVRKYRVVQVGFTISRKTSGVDGLHSHMLGCGCVTVMEAAA